MFSFDQTMVIGVTPVLWAQAEPSNTTGPNTHSSLSTLQSTCGRMSYTLKWTSQAARRPEQDEQQHCESWGQSWPKGESDYLSLCVVELSFSCLNCLPGEGQWVAKPVEPVRALCLCELEHPVSMPIKKVFTPLGSYHVLLFYNIESKGI